MISPAYIAPGTLPKPPSVTTTKAVRPKVSPTEGDHGYEIAISAPAIPAPPAASPQASACMRSGRMPISIAALRSSATASSCEPSVVRSEEHTSELQSLRHLVCRLLLEKKNNSNSLI